MDIYINGLGNILPQNTIGSEDFLTDVNEVNEKYMQVVQPVYKEYISPKALRRMSKIVRMGVVSAQIAMKEAGIDMPDAINTGTGIGCQADTEKFLKSMLDNNESMLNPSAFIQSTHNTIGGSIALGLGCNNYNMTYVHRTFSFESALLDSMMLITEGQGKNILVGGFDEITEESYQIRARINLFKNNECNNLNILNDNQPGALAGEGAVFSVVSDNKTDNSYCKIKGIDMFFNPDNQDEINTRINEFISRHNLSADDIDLVIVGKNGDKEYDVVYDNVCNAVFPESNTAIYKNLCGEFDTSSAFAVWAGSNIIKRQDIPEVMQQSKKRDGKIRNILIYNQHRNVNHSAILLSEC